MKGNETRKREKKQMLKIYCGHARLTSLRVVLSLCVPSCFPLFLLFLVQSFRVVCTALAYFLHLA